MTVSPDVVRALLTSDDAEPTLVLHKGQARVVPAADLRDGRYPGSVTVTSRDDLRRTAAGVDLDNPSDRDLRDLAERLDTAVEGLGG